MFDEGRELMASEATVALEVGTKVVTIGIVLRCSQDEGHHCTNIGITTMRASVPGG